MKAFSGGFVVMLVSSVLLDALPGAIWLTIAGLALMAAGILEMGEKR